MKTKLTLLLLSISFSISYSQTLSTNVTPVGMEHNLLFHATKRYTVTQTGATELNLPTLFDGRFTPSYTPAGLTPANPTVITIEGLPSFHTQRGVWAGWSTRYWEAKNFKIEAYDIHDNINNWRTIADYSNTTYTGGSNFKIKSAISGVFTKLRFTFYSASGSNGRLGVSELFFIHPEATRPYEGLGLGSWEKDGGKITSTAGHVVINHPTSDHASLQIGREANDRIIADNTATGQHYGAGYFFRVHDENATNKYRDAMMLASNGNIGVGIKPSSKLEVNGTTKIQGHSNNAEFLRFESDRPWSFINNGTDAASRLQLKSNVDSKFFDISAEQGNKVASFFTSNNSSNQKVVLVEEGGKVGIGTNNPKNKLSVNGTIWAKEVKVRLTDAADWVFEDDYKLPTLQEVAAFIKLNKHLPEMPSAEEFKNNDMKVSEMTNKLLQKIEELTLYTIKQEEKLEKQEKKLEQQALELQKMKEMELRLAKLESLIK